MDGAFHTNCELDIAILRLTEHFAFLALVAVRIDILEVVVNTDLLTVNLISVEATRDRTGYYGHRLGHPRTVHQIPIECCPDS